MAYSIEVDDVASVLVAAVRVRTANDRIGDDIATGFGRVMQTLGAEGIEPTGSPFIVYHDVIDADADGDIELCIPVSRAVAGDGVSGREVPGGTVAATVHRGSYEEVGAAHDALVAWIAAHGHAAVGPPREIYLNDPATVAPADVLTRVEIPVRPPDVAAT